MMGISEWCHYKCRNGFYPGTKIKRFPVPDNLTSWTNQPILMTQLRPIVKDWPEYAPVEYTSPTVPGKPWADPDITDPLFKPRWNAIDGDIDRRSNARGRPGVLYSYPLTDDGRPKNPLGRTGVTGRGLLGRWGPNHAADSIITRWKNTPTPSTAPKEDVIIEPGVLQFVAIKRQDTKQWAIPEGMVDPGGAVSDTLKREFMKEAMNSLGRRSKTAIHVYIRRIDELFKRGDVVYKGYIDDPRNTDNAWIETTAVNFHDNDGTILNKIPLSVGDDACKVQWMDIDEELELYGEHSMLLRYVTVLRNAHWKK